MSGHTPGPWKWSGSFLWNEPEDRGVLNHGAVAWKVRPENRRLIAAAPELLAALKRRRANCVCPDLPIGNAVCGDCKADALLIAKAESK